MAKRASILFIFWGTSVLSILAGAGITISSPAAHAPDQLIKQITKDPAHDYHVKWSPDGKTLAFASLRSGEPKIWLIPADGGDATLLETSLSGDHHISWAPDGTRIAFMSNRRGKRDVWITAVSGGEPFCFTAESDSSIAGSWPTWSPDGKKIAFASNRAGNQDIWIKDVK